MVNKELFSTNIVEKLTEGFDYSVEQVHNGYVIKHITIRSFEAAQRMMDNYSAEGFLEALAITGNLPSTNLNLL